MKAKYDNTIITDVDEFIDFVEENQLNKYYGFNEMTPVARLTARSNKIKVLIEYDSIVECKIIENKLKKRCIVFSPKEFDEGKGHIRAGNTLKYVLNELKKESSSFKSFESVIWDLIIEHYDNL